MTLRASVSHFLTVASLVCLFVVTGLTVRREFFLAQSASEEDREPEYVTDWPILASAGHRLGPTHAPVTIIEFIDFECPSCRRFALGARRHVQQQFPGQVSFVIRHWPLGYHRFALPAAQAAECASLQGRFHEIYDLFFSKQDSLGLKSFESYAMDSGVQDISAFTRCRDGSDAAARLAVDDRIAADTAAAFLAGGHGTPTIIVNGVRLGQPPSEAELQSWVAEALTTDDLTTRSVR
jgi:protein-disulfide isomerase